MTSLPKPSDDIQTSSKLLGNHSSDKNIQRISPTPPLLFSKRSLVAFMVFFSYVNFQTLRHNMNIAVVEMVSNKSCNLAGNLSDTTERIPEFDWDSKTVGLVNSVIAYGGVFSFLSGFVIDKLGGSVSCALCMFLCGITTIFHPTALHLSFYLFLACRCFTGILDAAFYVSTAEIASKWYPKQERTTLMAFAANGMNVGIAVSYPFGGYLACRWGWRMVFYVTGALSSIAGVLLQIMVRNHPSQDKWISKKELNYILENTDDSDTTKLNQIDDKKHRQNSHILKCMLTSAPLWALFDGQFSFMWIATVLSSSLPLYIRDLTQKDSDEIGYITSIPNMVHIFMYPIAGALIDYWKNHTNTSLTRIHKILCGSAFLLTSIIFIGAIFVSEFTASLVLFVLIQIFISVVPLILWLIIVSLAPRYTSHVASMSSVFYSLGTIASQTVTGFIVTNHSLQEWNKMFSLTAVVSIMGALIFVVYGSSEPQKWSL